ncbi:hypothetical protein ACFOUV_11795 [Oceanobacillus longus]|uniref:Uncharacterized protein n=1 Tax=Oceanobacillus longus TaxID=930120 RepID=A0ABV8H0C8_9BACI
MPVLVVNCDDWLGYHIVNKLLEQGYKVDGIVHSDRNDEPDEDLTMFFGRNSSFTMIPADKEKKYNIGIIAGDYDGKIKQKIEKLFVINPDKKEQRSVNHATSCTTIKAPLLFGEWMPMNEKGIFHKNEFIPFTSEKFKESSLYVQNFTKGLLQWMKVPNLPSELHIYSSNHKREVNTKLDKNIYLRDNTPNRDHVKTVIEHYVLFKKR